MSAVLAPLLLALLLAVALWRLGWLLAAHRWVGRALRQPVTLVRWAAALPLATFAAQALVALCIGLAVPRVADEFSYLLAGDTYARWRLTNPSPPLTAPFDTFYVLLRPTYASVYMPGQGLTLAIGERLGHPALGVWLAGALFAAAGAWMLHGWLRPPWARLGSLLLVATQIVATPWSQGYWGGSLAGLAGALLFGATGRLLRRPRRRDGLILGFGICLLGATRPWEGAVAAACALALLLTRMAARPASRRVLAVACLSTLPVLAAAALWLGYYDWRVTGSPTTLPYALYYDLHHSVPFFLWQRPQVPREPTPAVLTPFFRDSAAPAWRQQHTLVGWSRAAAEKSATLWEFYFGLALTPALLALPWALRRPGPRRAALAATALLASQLVVVLPTRAHYVAPGAALAALLAVEGWRQLRRWRPAGRRLGPALAGTVPLLALLAIPIRVADLRPPPNAWHLRRATLARRLAALPQPQLVLVRYGPAHNPQAEWVANGADLAGTRVLWARALSPREDCELLALESDRQAWLLEVAEELTAPRLLPFPRRACATAAPSRR